MTASLDYLAQAHSRGEEILTQKEMFLFAVGLIAAGFETVSTTFTNSAFIVLQRPDLLQGLKERVDDPERMAAAIDEILRITFLSSAGVSASPVMISPLVAPLYRLVKYSSSP